MRSASGNVALTFLYPNSFTQSAKLMTQREDVSFRDRSRGKYIKPTVKTPTTEVAGQRILSSFENTVSERIYEGKSGTSKGMFAPVREVTIGDMFPTTSAGALQPFTQARPAQAVSAVFTPVKVTGTVDVKTPSATVITPPVGILASVNTASPTQTIGQALGDRIVTADVSPLQDWKKLVPVALMIGALFFFGKGK